MGKKSRDKGAAFERTVAQWFTKALGVEHRRGLNQWRNGNEVADVEPVEGGGAFWIEAKKSKAQPRIAAALKQAEAAMKDRPMMPVAVTMMDRERPIVSMYADDFLDMLKEWRERASRTEAPSVTVTVQEMGS